MQATASSCCRSAAQRQPFVAPPAQQRCRQVVRRSGDAGAAGGSSSELPEALQGLTLSEDGQDLIDSKTGKVVNEFGATRFDVAVRAMRGEFDPPAFMDNTERSSGLLLDSLTQFPAVYDFQLVIKQQQGSDGSSSGDGGGGGGGSSSGSSSGSCGEQSPQALLARYRQLVADVTAADIPPEACSIKERMGGKYVSLTIPARVQAAHVIDLVWAALADDPRVIMKY